MIKIYKNYDKADVLNRAISGYDKEEEIVKAIIANVALKGDVALKEYTLRFDKVALDSFLVTEEEFAQAEKIVGTEFRSVLLRASKNIEEFHSRQIRQGFEFKRGDDILLGQKYTPIEKVGLYVPGGTASYPSTVLMNAIPARLAGVSEIVVATPCGADGKIKAEILVAAKLAGVGKVYKMGGAQAIAALAYGTESISKVDKIVGPGNIFVALAKKQVFGQVSIDMIAGPSEILVIADDGAKAEYVAADLLSQAEHDRLASAVLVTDSERLANSVAQELERQTKELARCEIATESLARNGKIIIVKSIEEGIAISNEIAPEHLELCVAEPKKYLEKVQNAGSVFLGYWTPEAVGDYFAGPNHTLPTSGSARFSSPLSVDDFVKKTQYVGYSAKGLADIAADVVAFADAEGLGAHAAAVKKRVK